MSLIVNTSSPRHERFRGRATHFERGISASNSHVDNRIPVCPNIDVTYRHTMYPRQTFDRSSWDLRNPAAAGLTAFTSTPGLRPRLATWFADNTMTFSYLWTLSVLSFTLVNAIENLSDQNFALIDIYNNCAANYIIMNM